MEKTYARRSVIKGGVGALGLGSLPHFAQPREWMVKRIYANLAQVFPLELKHMALVELFTHSLLKEDSGHLETPEAFEKLYYQKDPEPFQAYILEEFVVTTNILAHIEDAGLELGFLAKRGG